MTEGLLFGLSVHLITCLTGRPLLLPTQQFLFWFIMVAIVIGENWRYREENANRGSMKITMLFHSCPN